MVAVVSRKVTSRTEIGQRLVSIVRLVVGEISCPIPQWTVCRYPIIAWGSIVAGSLAYREIMNSWALGKSLWLLIPLLRDHTLMLVAGVVAAAVSLFAVAKAADYWRRGRQRRSVVRANREPLSILSDERKRTILTTPRQSANALKWEVCGNTSGHEFGSVMPGNAFGRGKTILIADDDPVVALALSQRLRRLGYQILRAPDATHALLAIKKTHPDLVIIDIKMPAGNGLAVCEMLACDQECAEIPIIIHSALADEGVKKRCRKLQTNYVEKSPRSWDEIRSLVESLLGKSEAVEPESDAAMGSTSGDGGSEELPSWEQSLASREAQPAGDDPRDTGLNGEGASADVSKPGLVGDSKRMVIPLEGELSSVLCIDDDPLIAQAIEMRLRLYGIKVTGIDNGTQGYLQAVTDPPDVILLDLKMPNGAGNYILGKLKDNPHTKNIPVVVLTADTGTGMKRLMTSLGADGFLTKPINWADLFQAMGRCARLPHQLLVDYGLSEQLTLQEI
jgi:CheY-like chemotaxis protein